MFVDRKPKFPYRHLPKQKQAQVVVKEAQETPQEHVAERTAQLAQAQADLNRAQAVAHVGSWRLDVRKDVLTWSPEAYRIFGIPENIPLSYESFLSTVHPDDREYVNEQWKAALTGTYYDIEHRIVVKGQIKWVREKAELEFDLEGNLLGGFGTVQDITGIKNAEQELTRERGNLQAIFDVVNTGLLLIDEDGIVKRVNNTVPKWVNKEVTVFDSMQPGDIVGCIHALSAPDGCGSTPYCNKCLIRTTFESVLASGKPIHGVELESTLSIDGKETRLWLEVSADPLVLDGKKNVILSINNITTRKEAQEVLKNNKEMLEKQVEEKSKRLLEAHLAMEQAKRLSDIGALASTVAHELRNPLAAIKLAAFNLKRKTADRPELQRHIASINTKTQESDQIINNLLFYSRLKSVSCERIRPYDILKETFGHAKAAGKGFKKVRMVNKFGCIKGLFMEADPLQLKELFFNIVNNAYDAVADGSGVIEIGAKPDQDDRVLFYIKDNGSGIDKENLEKIFEPFFSTKSKGTGLGLSVCRQIAHLHRGDISIESAKGKGTSVSIVLPLKRPA